MLRKTGRSIAPSRRLLSVTIVMSVMRVKLANLVEQRFEGRIAPADAPRRVAHVRMVKELVEILSHWGCTVAAGSHRSIAGPV